MQRRDFLKLTGAASVAFLSPRFALAQSAAGYENLLVLVELKGGNDGLNTVVPYADRTYYSLRPRLAIKREEVLQLDGRTGLNPALAALMPLWQSRELAVVQGVGYPRPNLSHFRSIEIWDTASKSDQYLADGWLARAFAARPVPQRYAADGVVIGSQDLGPLTGTGARAIALNNTAQFERQARMAHPAHARGNSALSYVMKIEQDVAQAAAGLQGDHDFRTVFPQGPFGNAVKTAAQVIASPGGVAAVRLTLNGFDMHVNQPNIHANLLKQLAEGLAGLKSALVELGRWDRTLVMTYAEFGRRPQENGSNGTDHGTANAHFVAGGRVRGGLYGQPPQLDRLENGNLAYAIDFRSLYATALERWWGVP
ncbi:MAG: DUF1501 domain-containing protein, partial [Burkholderiales bacterium]